MKPLKGLLDVLSVAYVVFTLLLLTGVADANAILGGSPETQTIDLYKSIVAAGGVILLARVLMSSVYIADLKHDRYRAQLKINGLKADLYEKRQAFRSNSYKEAKEQEQLAEEAA